MDARQIDSDKIKKAMREVGDRLMADYARAFYGSDFGNLEEAITTGYRYRGNCPSCNKWVASHESPLRCSNCGTVWLEGEASEPTSEPKRIEAPKP